MNNTDFNIDALIDYEEDLMKRVNTDMPEKSAHLLDQASDKLKSRLEDKTPVSEKKKRKNERLKFRWKKGKVTWKFGSHRTKVSNVAPHAWLYENGHIAENGNFVKGSHLFEQELEETEKEIVNGARKLIDEVLGD